MDLITNFLEFFLLVKEYPELINLSILLIASVGYIRFSRNHNKIKIILAKVQTQLKNCNKDHLIRDQHERELKQEIKQLKARIAKLESTLLNLTKTINK